jgi:aminoglycoside phosphotransferase family enzyme/predicted kinase
MSFVDDLRAGASELRETHISWVFLFESVVLKVKKPVDFGFLNFTTLERRLAACHAEVRLNSRLAPGVYLGVVPVLRESTGQYRFGTHAVDGDHSASVAPAADAPPGAEVVDYAVQMVRLPDAERADVRLAAEQLELADLEQLARVLARFHAGAATGGAIDEFGSAENIRRNVRENFAQAHRALAAVASEAEQQEVETRQLEFLSAYAGLFEARILEQRIRDGHGDLRLEHVYFRTGVERRILDCIEFNERFRFGDVCSDVAFLSMDLAWHGRVRDKERFLAAYARESGDYDLYGLVDFYESYRAYVRAKVSAIGYSAPGTAGDARERLQHDARRYFLLALASERPAVDTPRLIAVGGIIASGKSTLADALGQKLAVPVLSTDRTRKAMFGVSPTTPLGGVHWQEAYSEAHTERVYAEVLRRAAVVLRSGRSVVIDASFRSRALRRQVRELAFGQGASFAFLECRVPPEVSRQRLEARAKGPSVSDGRAELLDEFSARYEPVVELGAAEHAVIDTSGPLESSVAAAFRLSQ